MQTMKKINLAVLLQSLVLILAPLYILRFKVLIPTTILEVLIILTIIVTSIEFFRDGKEFKKLKTRFDFAILLFLGTVTVSAFQGPNLASSLGILKAYFIEPVIFFYCLVYTARKYGYRYILNSLLISGFWLSILGIIQKITGNFSLAPYEIIQGRIPALYNSANSLALYLGPIIILSLGLFSTERPGTKKFLYFLLLLLFIVVMVWTRSRGGMVALLLGMIVFAYTLLAFRNTVLQKIWYVVPALTLILVATFFYLFYLNYNFLPVNDGRPYTQGDTLQIRFFIWVGTINMIRDHPIFGAGLDGFKELYSNQYRLPQFQEEFQYPHNLILTFWTETGIFGLFAFIYLLVGSLGVLIKKIPKSKIPILGGALIAAITYWVLHGVVDVPYFKNDLSVEFWTILALVQLWQEN